MYLYSCGNLCFTFLYRRMDKSYLLELDPTLVMSISYTAYLILLHFSIKFFEAAGYQLVHVYSGSPDSH